MGTEFPVGAAALHPDWPEARFTVSGLFRFDPLVLGYMKFVAVGFGIRGSINSLHGAPDCLWNGGRVSQASPDRNRIQTAVAILNQNGIGCFATLTNHLIDADDLADPLCNFILDRIAARPDINGVIVSSEGLSKHIAGRYPALPQVASIVKVTMENGRGSAAYYADLGRRFSRYVVHPDDCHDRRLLEQLDRDKAEIIVNENCARQCPVRARHYDAIARVQRQSARARGAAAGTLAQAAAQSMAGTAEMRELEKTAEACQARPITKQLYLRKRNCNFTRAEMKRVYDMGFRRFKLQGRDNHLYNYVYDLTRYTLESDVAAPLVLKTMVSEIQVQVTAPGVAG